MASMRGAQILHFAPEDQLQRFIEAAGPSRYVRADLHPRHRRVCRLDLTSIAFPDDYFDFVIANHVLEHVENEASAVCEIFRVLRPGGHAVLQTPFSNRLATTFEDASITGDAERLRAFGQEDHCRLYGRDFGERVVSFGFVSKIACHEELLAGVDSRASGVNPREPFLLFLKPEVA
jgi:SAM-dependent methyltransferase